MPLGKRQRKILLGSGLIILGLLVFWLAQPLWFPWLLRPLAARQGAYFSTYTREGYSRFKITGLTLTNRSVKVSADTLEALIPSVWLWKLAQGTNSGSNPFVLISGWNFVSLPSPGPSATVYSEVQKSLALFARLKTWLPVARLSQGTVHLEQTAIDIPNLTWTRGVLSGLTVLPEPTGRVAIHADFSSRAPFQLEASSDPLRLRSRIRLRPTPTGFELQSTSYWWSNQIELAAQFGRSGRLPERASLNAPEFVIPSQLVDVAPYRGVQGALTAKWEHEAFALDLRLQTEPPATQTNLPPLQFQLHAVGDTNSATIQTARLTALGVTASLSRDLAVNFHGPLLRGPAQLTLAADLSRQTWFPFEGQLRGEADFAPSGGKFPRGRFDLTGSQVGTSKVRADRLTVAGSLDWPHLLLTNASAQFADGSSVATTAELDVEKRTVERGDLRFTGPLVRRWLPPSYAYKDLSIALKFKGPFAQIEHQGKLKLSGFSCPFLRPIEVDANWSGQQLTLQNLQLELSAGAARLQAKGAFTNAETLNLRLDSLVLVTNTEPLLSLTHPAVISLAPPRAGHGWQLSSSPIVWSGPGGKLQAAGEVDWPRSGKVNLGLERVSSTLFSGFGQGTWPQIDLDELRATANWSNGPAAYRLEFSGAKLMPPRTPASPTNTFQIIPLTSELRLYGNSGGLAISNLQVYSQTSAVLTVQGFVPLTVNPSARTNLVKLEPYTPLQLRATASPHAFFWNEFTLLTGVKLKDPRLNLKLTGNWESPRGQVDLRARELRLQKALTNLPTLTELTIKLQLDKNQARLIDTHLLVQGQPVTLQAQIPLGPRFLSDLQEKKLPNLDQASAQLRIQDAELAAFEPLFPNILAPQGNLHLDITLKPGGKLSGQMAIQNARTRPLGDFGPIRDVNIKCSFQDRHLKLESASAQISGSLLNITGQADLRGTEWLQHQLPPFVLRLHGTNVPLVRQPEVVVRSDLDLSVLKTNAAAPVVSGRVHFRDSFFLADLTALIPGKIAGPTRRPPYFSMEDPFLADWHLAITADGVRFLKVRTPLFNGEVSANLNLQGTLENPIALGDLKIESGVVRFPFASLDVQQGLVSLSSQDPYHPQLTVNAASKQFGYDIRMNVTGPVDAPVIQFNSTPPLSSEQILLMVTAGELPQGTFSLTPQQRAQTMAMFFGRDLLSKLGLGDQAQERLTIRSGEEISEQGRPTYHVEYKLSNRWSLVGEYDRFGDFNAGFKWRILSR